MGRPYQSELAKLSSTTEWATSVEVKDLAASLFKAPDLPLVLVGSGGSLAACQYGAELYERSTGTIAKAMTPLEYIESSRTRGTVLIVSAAGRNPDILDAFRTALLTEAAKVIVICGRSEGPLVSVARRHPQVKLHVFPLPSGKDGFLATNSLLAFYIILYRALCLHPEDSPAQESFAAILKSAFAPEKALEIEQVCAPLWNREHLIALYGPSLLSVGMDLESRFTEAALGTIQLADYRNFAHGRHYWLAKRGGNSAVLAFVTARDQDIARRTLALIPTQIPKAVLDLKLTGPVATIIGLWSSMHIAGLAGGAREMDPGRPTVPQFGRKLYHLRRSREERPSGSAPQCEISLGRKMGALAVGASNRGAIIEWQTRFRKFADRLLAARYASIVFDYDGTLCSPDDRYLGVSGEVGKELTRILKAGTKVGVATGRGKSVREDLRRALPKGLWTSVTVAYYNGGEVGTLDDEQCPLGSPIPAPALKELALKIKGDLFLRENSKITVREQQLSIESTGASLTAVWTRVSQIAAKDRHVKVLSSSHSIDIVPLSISKLDVLKRLSAMHDRAGETLCIGDRGLWPGNDYELLSTPYSLSVDQVSQDPESCWNLAPSGMCGVDATLYYIRHLKRSSGGLQFKGVTWDS